MLTPTDLQPLKPRALRHAKLLTLLVLALVGTQFWHPATGSAEEGIPKETGQKLQNTEVLEQKQMPSQKPPEVLEPKTKPAETVEQKPKLSAVAELKEKAQDAFVHSRYAEAVAYNLKIAQKYPASKERHYAVQMLGTLYEDNVVDLKQAMKWDEEFLKRYADSRQAPIYKEKLARFASVEKAGTQDQAYKSYRKIKFANKGDAYLVKQYEALLKEHPDFTLKVEVQKEIAYAYDRMNRPKESYQALQAIVTQNPGKQLSSTDQIMSEANHSYWEMTTDWKWVAWAVVAALWGAAFLMKPWRRMDRAAIRSYLIWTVCWVLLMASRMPTFYSMETEGYLFVIDDRAIYTMAAMNLPVILWIMLFTRGEYWLSRPRALRLLSPTLALVMTVASIYLFVAYQPNGPAIVSVFGVKYEYLIGEFRNHRI